MAVYNRLEGESRTRARPLVMFESMVIHDNDKLPKRFTKISIKRIDAPPGYQPEPLQTSTSSF